MWDPWQNHPQSAVGDCRHIRAQRDTETCKPALCGGVSGSRLLPTNLDRQSVTNGQNVRLMESKHQGTQSHTVFSQQLVAWKMVGPRATVVSIISAVCLTSLSVFLFISRTQIGKAISPQMRLQECALPVEQRTAGGAYRLEDPAIVPGALETVVGNALLSTHLARLWGGCFKGAPSEASRPPGGCHSGHLQARC